MKKLYKALLIVPVATALFAASSAHACSVPNSTTEDVRDVVVRHGGWPISDAHCDFLNKQHLDLSIDAHFTVLDGASVSWVVVHLLDPDTNIVSDRLRERTSVNRSVASMDRAESDFYEALTAALREFEYDVAANEVKAYRAKVRKQVK